MRKIDCKFADVLIVPHNAVNPSAIDCLYETRDGVVCRLAFESGVNNEGGQFDDFMERKCKELYGCGFSSIKSLWLGRLGRLDDYWHLVKMIKI